MNNASNREAIRLFIIELLGHGDFRDDTPLLEGGYLDSMQAIELVMFLASQFSIDVGQDDMRTETFASVNAMISFVEQRLGHG